MFPFGGRLRGTVQFQDPRSPWNIWFWIFLAFSVALFAFGMQEVWRGWRTHSWPRVQCKILTSASERNSGGDFVFQTSYRYEFQDKSYISEKRVLGTDLSHSDIGPVQDLITKYPEGAETVCFVNPEDPTVAVLERGADYTTLFIAPIPLALWAAMSLHSLRAWSQRRRLEKSRFDDGPISDNRPLKRANRRTLIVGFLGSAMGVVFTIMTVVLPLNRSRLASAWERVPCTIISSDIKTEYGQHGPTYHPDVLYSYSFGGRDYKSSRLDFGMDFGTSFFAIQAAVARHPAGEKTVCYVDPNHPDKAVIERAPQLDWFFALFSFAMFGSSAYLILNGARAVARGCQPLKHFTGMTNRERKNTSSQAQLKLEMRPLPALAGYAAMALACAALSTPLLIDGTRTMRLGHFDTIHSFYGVGALVGFLYAMAKIPRLVNAARHPPPQLSLKPGVLMPCEPAELQWNFKHGANRVRGLRFFLEGREEARVTTTAYSMHGPMKHERKNKRTFATVPVAEFGPHDSLRNGKIPLPILPVETMHSFECRKCKIIWSLRVEIDSPQLVEHRFRLVVQPNPKLPA